MARRRGMAWKPRQLKPVIVRRIPAVGRKNLFYPMEDHPDWDLFAGSGPTTLFFNSILGEVWTETPISSGTFWPMIYSGYGQIDDVDMSFVATYDSGNNTDYESYLAVKGIDADNFVGVTVYNGAIRVYDHIGGTWNIVIDGGSDADIVGKTIRFTVVGSDVELFIDGVSVGTGTTAISGRAYLGMMIRGFPKTGKLLTDMNFQGRNIGNEVQLVPCDRSGWSFGASSVWDDMTSIYGPHRAFDCTTSGGGDAWISHGNPSGGYPGPPPQWVEIIQDADIHYQPTRLVMKGRVVISDPHMDARRPDPLVLYGSNNGTDWTEIQRWVNTGPWGAGQEKTFIVTSIGEYKHFRFVWENYGDADSDQGCQIGWIKLFGYDVDYPQGEIVTYQGSYVTHNGEVVTHG